MEKRQGWISFTAVAATALMLLWHPTSARAGEAPLRQPTEIVSQNPGGETLADSDAAEIRADIQELLAASRFAELHVPSKNTESNDATEYAFYRHVLGGLRVFRERGGVYERLSQGASRKITRRVMLFQRVFLPLAWLVDRRAHRFQRRGIPIIKADLMPVAGLPDPETPPKWRGRLAPDPAKRLAAELGAFKSLFRARVKTADFAGAAAAAHRTLRLVRDLESREGCHLAMTAHFLESLGLCALHADRYARESGGGTLPLSKAFLNVQLFPFGGTLAVDLEGQSLHARGIGILVNDVPAIPFEQEYSLAKP